MVSVTHSILSLTSNGERRRVDGVYGRCAEPSTRIEVLSYHTVVPSSLRVSLPRKRAKFLARAERPNGSVSKRIAHSL